MSDDSVSSSVVSCRTTVIHLQLSESVKPIVRLRVCECEPSPVVGQFVHETVEEGGTALTVHSELSALREVVALSDIVGVFSLSNPHLKYITSRIISSERRPTYHPQKLVDVVSRVADHSAEDDQDVVNIQLGHDGVGGGLIAGHGLPHQGDVTIVPGIVVNLFNTRKGIKRIFY